MDIETDIEFSVGDKVTFKAYEKAVQAVVREVYRGFGFNDQRVVYVLHGYGKRSLLSHCTGNSIIESKYYGCIKHKLNRSNIRGVMYE